MSESEWRRQQAESIRLREMGDRMRMENEAAVRRALEEFYPSGLPEGLVERICQIQNGLIKKIVRGEKVMREMHDGINRIAEESAQRWVDGFETQRERVRLAAAERGMSEEMTAVLTDGNTNVEMVKGRRVHVHPVR